MRKVTYILCVFIFSFTLYSCEKDELIPPRDTTKPNPGALINDVDSESNSLNDDKNPGRQGKSTVQDNPTPRITDRNGTNGDDDDEDQNIGVIDRDGDDGDGDGDDGQNFRITDKEGDNGDGDDEGQNFRITDKNGTDNGSDDEGNTGD